MRKILLNSTKAWKTSTKLLYSYIPSALCNCFHCASASIFNKLLKKHKRERWNRLISLCSHKYFLVYMLGLKGNLKSQENNRDENLRWINQLRSQDVFLLKTANNLLIFVYKFSHNEKLLSCVQRKSSLEGPIELSRSLDDEVHMLCYCWLAFNPFQ